MGLGVGVYCKICNKQLYYDTDCEEIVANKDICHSCSVIKKIVLETALKEEEERWQI